MKLSYIKPSIIVVKAFCKEELLAESKWNVHGEGDDTNPITIQPGDPEGGIFSKKNNLWDDWED